MIYGFEAMITLSIRMFLRQSFQQDRIELSPSLDYDSRDLSISTVVKLLYWTTFFEILTYSSVSPLKIKMTGCFNQIIKIVILDSVLEVYISNAKFQTFIWQNWRILYGGTQW